MAPSSKISIYYCLAILLLSLSCYKQEGELVIAPPKIEYEDDTKARLQQNAVVIDSTSMNLISDEQELEQGIYKFDLKGDQRDLREGDVIVGEQSDGYLRKVIKVEQNGNVVRCVTEPASMEELFATGDFNFEMDLNGIAQVKTLGVKHDFPKISLYDANGVSLFVKGSVGLETDIDFDFSFSSEGIDKFVFETRNAHFSNALTVGISAKKKINLINQTKTLASFRKSKVLRVQVGLVPVPVMVRLRVDLNLNYSADLDAGLNASVTLTNNNALQLGARYENGSWEGSSGVNPSFDLSWVPLNGSAKATVNLELVPEVYVEFYRVIGPYFSVGLREQLEGAIASPELDWDFTTSVWLAGTVGARVEVLGKTLADFSNTLESDKLQYRTPYELKILSGEGQEGPEYEPLDRPLRVRVLDEFGQKQSGVPVYFTVKTGDGTVSPESILTDIDGIAEAVWTVGSANVENQTLAAEVRKADGTNVVSSPQIFNAAVSDSIPIFLNILAGHKWGGYLELIEEAWYISGSNSITGCCFGGSDATYTYEFYSPAGGDKRYRVHGVSGFNGFTRYFHLVSLTESQFILESTDGEIVKYTK